MNWKEPFAIFRINSEGKFEQVYVASDIKSARYWLTYIAIPGDVLCRTPAHPKHSKGSNKPEYWSHKEKSGTASSDEERWKKFAESRHCNFEFPDSECVE